MVRRPQNFQRQHNRSSSTAPIFAPYNFVPLAAQVVEPDWADRVSHDWPFQDGVSGEIGYTLAAHSPLLVAGSQNEGNTKRFFRIAEGENGYAIHGATLKGMIRSVLEIASFSRMTLVEDARYAVRDLTPQARPFYGKNMTHNERGTKDFRALPQAAWLRFEDGQWRIRPCAYSRVQHDYLGAFRGDDWWNAVPRCNAEDKYNQWAPHSLEIDFDPGPIEWKDDHSDGKRLEYSLAGNLGSGSTHGTLVLTGQPAGRPTNPPENRRGKKHLEFIFHSDAPSERIVPENVMHDFLEIHRPRREFGYDGREWSYWERKPRIPVFCLTDNKGQIASLGLALMYKLPYKKTVHEAMPTVHRNDKKPDLATLMFGYAGDDAAEKSLRGRVRFETAEVVAGTAHPSPEIQTVLNSPKPSYYPNYIKQAYNKDGNRNVPYRTFMDDNPEIRGWKRYPARSSLSEPTLGAANVTQTLHPLADGVKFKGRVVFHNLKPVELGALIWSLTWGGRTDLMHSLGTGKPMGLGQVTLGLDDVQFTSNDGSKPMERTKYQEYFVNFMSGQIKDWAKSPQIKALCGMASPAKATAFQGRLKHMSLGDGPQTNQFQNAKKGNRVLAEYPGLTWTPPSPASIQANRDHPTEWKSVRLQYNRGSGEVSTTGPNGARGFANRQEAKPLVESLNLTNSQKARFSGQGLTVTVTVEYIGGKNWRIVKIDALQ